MCALTLWLSLACQCVETGMKIFSNKALMLKKTLEKRRFYREAAGPVTCSLQVWLPLFVCVLHSPACVIPAP